MRVADMVAKLPTRRENRYTACEKVHPWYLSGILTHAVSVAWNYRLNNRYAQMGGADQMVPARNSAVGAGCLKIFFLLGGHQRRSQIDDSLVGCFRPAP